MGQPDRDPQADWFHALLQVAPEVDWGLLRSAARLLADNGGPPPPTTAVRALPDGSNDSDDERWTVRGVPKSYRIEAAEAAARGNIKVGAWLCGLIDIGVNLGLCDLEREPVVLMPPRPASDTAPDTGDAAARLALAERAVAASIALANTPGLPTGFRRRANRLLREALPAPTPRVTMTDRRAETALQHEALTPP